VSAAIRSGARAFLEPDEEIRFIFPAEVALSATPCVIFVITDRSVTVLSTGSRQRAMPRSVLSRYRRAIRLGPVDLRPTPAFTLFGIRYELDAEYAAVVNAADAEVSGNALPPDPLPDL
jgi:hypothetical protein